MLFKEFDLVEGFVPDWMHGICLGLIKNLLAFWLNGEHKSKDFYIGNKVYKSYRIRMSLSLGLTWRFTSARTA